MANTNCLEGFQCPQCESYGPFRIEVTMTVLMYDEGSEDDDMSCDQHWGSDSYCACHECHYHGTAKDFQTPAQPSLL